MKKIIRNLLCWAFPEIEEQIKSYRRVVCLAKEVENNIELLLQSFEVSADVHTKEGSWAVISIQGEKKTLIKFIDLSDKDIREISTFLRNFERRKIDAHPHIKNWIECVL